ncbi:MAG: WYL domain-containing protein [Synergistaceae bacterium]|nr:WYL domain-containing protein [Synergistaceae bacterium]
MGREISSVRIRRLLKLAAYLRKKGEAGAEVSDLITHCEYSGRRALQDDIRLLRDEYKAGITFRRDYPRRYCMTYEGEFLMSLSLNMNDISALCIGLGMASHFVPDFKSHCRELWHKIAEIVPDSFVELGEILAGLTTIQHPVSGIKPWVFETVLEAIHEHEAIEIDYISPYGDRKVKTHRISPYDMFFKAHSWYMAAGDGERILTFRLSRIERIIIPDDGKFIPPPDDYSPEIFRQSSWYVKGGQLRHTIRLEIREPMASIVSEMKRHPTQRITRLNDDTIELTATIPDLEEAARWILSCSPGITVKAPDELREMVCDLARKVIAANSTAENTISGA